MCPSLCLFQCSCVWNGSYDETAYNSFANNDFNWHQILIGLLQITSKVSLISRKILRMTPPWKLASATCFLTIRGANIFTLALFNAILTRSLLCVCVCLIRSVAHLKARSLQFACKWRRMGERRKIIATPPVCLVDHTLPECCSLRGVQSDLNPSSNINVLFCCNK